MEHLITGQEFRQPVYNSESVRYWHVSDLFEILLDGIMLISLS